MEKKAFFGYGHTLVACCTAYVVQAVVNNFVPLLFVLFMDVYDFTPLELSGLIGLNFGVQLLVDLLSSGLIDFFGYRTSILFAHALSTVGLLGLGFLPDRTENAFLGVAVCVICYAIGGGIIEVLVSPIVEGGPSDKKESTMSLLHSFYCWGHVFVIVASTLFFKFAGISQWRVLAALWSFVPALNTLFFVFVPINKPVEDEQKIPLKRLLGSGVFWLLFLLMFCAGAAEQGMSQWASAFAEAGLNVDKTIGDLLGPCMFAICMGTSRLLYSKHSSKLKLQRVMIYSCTLCVFSYLLAVVSGTAVFSLVGCALTGFSVGILWPGTFSLASSNIPGGGTAMFAFLALAGDLGCGSGPALVGIVSDIYEENLKKGMIIAIIFPTAMIIAIMMANKKLSHRLLKETKTWIGLAFATLIITGSALFSGCSGETVTDLPGTPTPQVLNNQDIKPLVTDTPTPSPSPLPTDTPIPTPTDTPVPVATNTPTNTPIPTDTPTPTMTRKPTLTPTPTVAVAKVEVVARTGIAVCTVDSLRVRKLPTTVKSEIIGGLKKNEEAQITGEVLPVGSEKYGWWQISYGGGKGYISQEFAVLKGTATATPTKAANTAAVTPTKTNTPTPKATSTPTPEVKKTFEAYVNFTGKAYVAMDAKTGEILHSYNPNLQLAPASLTKMMTALVAVDQYYASDLMLINRDVLLWNDVYKEDGTKLTGEDNEMSTLQSLLSKKYTYEQWLTTDYTCEERLYQLLLVSAADAAEALSRTVDEECGKNWFVEDRMKDKCDELGLKDSYFTNAVGADEDFYSGIYSSAYDLSVIARNLLKNDLLRKIVSTKTYSLRASGDIPAITLTNTNYLLTKNSYKSEYFNCIGIKTGFTDEAGYNLCAAGEDKYGREVIVVVLGGKSKESTAEQTKNILEYIFRYELEQ